MPCICSAIDNPLSNVGLNYDLSPFTVFSNAIILKALTAGRLMNNSFYQVAVAFARG